MPIDKIKRLNPANLPRKERLPWLRSRLRRLRTIKEEQRTDRQKSRIRALDRLIQQRLGDELWYHRMNQPKITGEEARAQRERVNRAVA